MKRRILVLLFAALCITALLSSCGDANCVHADADKNNVCDSCSMPVVTITEYVTAEEEVVETVVKPMPGNVKFSEYVIPESVEIITGSYTAADNIYRSTTNRNNLYIVTYQEESEDGSSVTDFVRVYDAANDKTVYSFTSDEHLKDNYDVNSAEVRFENDFVFRVRLYLYNDEMSSFVTSYEYYTYSGEKISSCEDAMSFSINGSYDGLVYLIQDGVTYALDTEAAKVIYKDESATFVYRPRFTAMSDTVGVVMSGNMVYAYDLTKWIECVYSYRIPAYYEKLSTFCLADGKVLIQGERPTTTDAVNYDFLVETPVSSTVTQVKKYFIDYILVDTAAKTASEVEFGYYVTSASPADTDSIRMSGAKNYLEIYRIENKLKTSEIERIYVDADLNIVANLTTNNPVMVSVVYYVASGIYKGTVRYGDGSEVEAVFDDSGKQIAILPTSYTVLANMLCIDNKLYTWDMKERLDLDEYSVEYMRDDYLILSKYNEEAEKNEYFFYAANSASPVLIANSETTSLYNSSNRYYVIFDTSDAENSVFVYYNVLGEKILTSEQTVSSIEAFEGGWKVIFYDGTVGFIR